MRLLVALEHNAGTLSMLRWRHAKRDCQSTVRTLKCFRGSQTRLQDRDTVRGHVPVINNNNHLLSWTWRSNSVGDTLLRSVGLKYIPDNCFLALQWRTFVSRVDPQGCPFEFAISLQISCNCKNPVAPPILCPTTYSCGHKVQP